MKKYFYFAAAALALASCASDDFVGGEKPTTNEGAISFNMETPAQTRATGSDAATALGNRFVVWGEKNETDGTAASAANLVFKNYKVEYTASTANTTTSNTLNWEYVGLTPYSQVGPEALTGAQTIKYWDYGATSYTFTAVSALDADITGSKVVVTKTTSGTTKYDKGYTLAIKAGASVDNIFVADRKNIAHSTGSDRTAVNAYGGNVTLSFRNLMAKIRFGMFETIPGYKVSIDKVYYNSTNSAANFGVDGNFVVAGDNTSYTVSYYDNASGIENQVKMTLAAGANTQSYFETATSPIASTTAAAPLATTNTTPTWDKTAGAYTTILPNPANATNTKLKIDYTLTSEDTGETITVVGATAEIPATYCQWKSNFAYTYIFKISDNTNGTTGGDTDPKGLYPLTFDAATITDVNGNEDYITTVSEPSITTFGYDTTNKKYIAASDDYSVDSDIYATFVEGSAVKTPVLGTTGASHVNIYYVTTADATNFPITEASVAESIANPTNNKITATDVTTKKDSGESPTPTTTYFTAVPSVVSSVPAADGTTKTVDAVKLTGVKAGTYAIEYEASAAWTGSYKKVYKIVVVK